MFLLQCEGIMEEYEDDIIQHYTSEDEIDSYIQICRNVSKLCKSEEKTSANADTRSNDEL